MGKKNKFEYAIFCREIKGTHNIVVATISVLKEIINNTHWNTAKYELLFKAVVSFVVTHVHFAKTENTFH